MRSNKQNNQNENKINEFIKFLEKAADKGIISKDEKEKYEYDCALIQANEPSNLNKLFEAIDNIYNTIGDFD